MILYKRQWGHQCDIQHDMLHALQHAQNMHKTCTKHAQNIKLDSLAT